MRLHEREQEKDIEIVIVTSQHSDTAVEKTLSAPDLSQSQVGSLTSFMIILSLNYIKQLRLKEDFRLSRGFSMETLPPHEHDIHR